MSPADQLQLEFEAPPVLKFTGRVNVPGALIEMARTSISARMPIRRVDDMAIWGTACGHVMVGIRGGVQ